LNPKPKTRAQTTKKRETISSGFFVTKGESPFSLTQERFPWVRGKLLENNAQRDRRATVPLRGREEKASRVEQILRAGTK